MPITTPIESFYLELGLLPISVIIKMKRVKYLHYLLTKKRTEMLSIFFWSQWRNPSRGDWVYSVRQDLNDLCITDDLETIALFSKFKFKQLVKSKAMQFALNLLLTRKLDHSKLDNLEFYDLKMQSYFSLNTVTVEQVRATFLFRVRMSDFAGNYRGKEIGRLCPLCQNHLDTQDTLPDCKVIRDYMSDTNIRELLKVVYSSHVDSETVMKISEILKYREVKQD